jgi:hypothetical protein
MIKLQWSHCRSGFLPHQTEVLMYLHVTWHLYSVLCFTEPLKQFLNPSSNLSPQFFVLGIVLWMVQCLTEFVSFSHQWWQLKMAQDTVNGPVLSGSPGLWATALKTSFLHKTGNLALIGNLHQKKPRYGTFHTLSYKLSPHVTCTLWEGWMWKKTWVSTSSLPLTQWGTCRMWDFGYLILICLESNW